MKSRLRILTDECISSEGRVSSPSSELRILFNIETPASSRSVIAVEKWAKV